MNRYTTRHGRKRLRQRLGLKKKAHARHIQKVLRDGLVEYRDMEKKILYVWYDCHKYIFSNYKNLEARLITVFPRDKKQSLSNHRNHLTPFSLMKLDESRSA